MLRVGCGGQACSPAHGVPILLKNSFWLPFKLLRKMSSWIELIVPGKPLGRYFMKESTLPPTIFTGSIPGHYDQYLGPMFFEPYAIHVVGLFDPAAVKSALELGCGTG